MVVRLFEALNDVIVVTIKGVAYLAVIWATLIVTVMLWDTFARHAGLFDIMVGVLGVLVTVGVGVWFVWFMATHD